MQSEVKGGDQSGAFPRRRAGFTRGPGESGTKGKRHLLSQEPMIAVPSGGDYRSALLSWNRAARRRTLRSDRTASAFTGSPCSGLRLRNFRADKSELVHDVVRPTQLPSFKNEFAPSGNVYASVRQTRFGVKSSTPTPYGDLNTIFEFELFGTGVDAGQTTFRLRHAYGELGQFGAGQTWSPFMDIGVFPNTVEYWGPNGMVFFRNVQIRWMPIRKKTGSVTIALERPGASGDQGTYSDRIELSNIRPRFNFPDLSGNARIDRNWGYLQVAGAHCPQNRLGKTLAATPSISAPALWGWGVNTHFQSQFVKKQCRKKLACSVYGAGIENYDGRRTGGRVGIQNQPNSPIPIKGVALRPVLGVVAVSRPLSRNKHFTSSVGYSLVDIQNSNAEANGLSTGVTSRRRLLLYHPIPQVMMGSEFQFGEQVNFSNGYNFNDYQYSSRSSLIGTNFQIPNSITLAGGKKGKRKC